MNELAMQHISDFLGVETPPALIDETPTAVALIDEKPQALAVIETTPEDKVKEFDDDFDQARQILKRILTKTEDSFDDLVEIAKISESPRAFEIVGSTAKTMADVAKQLVDLHDSRKVVAAAAEQASTKIGEVHNMIVTTSDDLIRHLKANRDGTTN